MRIERNVQRWTFSSYSTHGWHFINISQAAVQLSRYIEYEGEPFWMASLWWSISNASAGNENTTRIIVYIHHRKKMVFFCRSFPTNSLCLDFFLHSFCGVLAIFSVRISLFIHFLLWYWLSSEHVQVHS